MEHERQRAPGGEALLSGAGLRREFGGVWAVADATFGLRRGAITSLIGPNGAGKSTVVGIVGGAIAPSAGRMVFDGADITTLPPHHRARMGLVRTYQLSSEFGRLTVLENLLVARPGQRGERMRTLLYGKRDWRRRRAAGGAPARIVLDGAARSGGEDEHGGTRGGRPKWSRESAPGLRAPPHPSLWTEPMAGVNPTRAMTIEGYLAGLAAEGLT